MYTYFWRSSPYPALTDFDSPDATTTCTRRNRSNTPLQALTLLNDEAFFEFAQGVAERVWKEGPSSNSGRVTYAYRLCLGRHPSPEERERLERFLAGQLDDFRTHLDEARPLLPQNASPKANAAQLAAWTSVSRALLNLDEFITRE
jgi:hypothetical protein